MKKIIVSVFFFFSVSLLKAQEFYPLHWWAGMQNQHLQLMIHGENLGRDYSDVSTDYPGVRIDAVSRQRSPNYLFVDLYFDRQVKPGTISFELIPLKGRKKQLTYTLKEKPTGNGRTRVQGVSSADLIYLLMPDRFSNGDPSNDFFSDMRDTNHDRNSPFDRHGGDLQGVINHLDYMKELGVTTLWMTPVVENDMASTMEGGTSRSTYHGYAFTNHYQIDRRLGGNAKYHELSDALHAKGMKLIQDAVYNHIGNGHWLFRDLPDSNWLNQWPAYQNSSYKDQPLSDPHAAQIDKDVSEKGWFTPFMADLNQNNPYVSNFLIQYAIWATEEFGIDGWRVDTYFYSDPYFLNKVNDALLEEFPSITVFGEAWVQTPAFSAYFCENNLDVPFKHNLQGVTDFPFLFATLDALKQPFGWDNGVQKLYQTLAQDFLYKDPSRNCIFLDNHDLDRFFSVVRESLPKYKMGMALLLTQRGIPQLYYGDEILMKNFKNPTDAEVRKDFPGGWAGDPDNKFIASGRTEQENEAFNYVKTIANFRRQSDALKSGKLMQYLPVDGVYVYFRYTDAKTVMCVVNTNNNESTLQLNRFEESLKGAREVIDVATGTPFTMGETLTLGPQYVLILDVK